MRPNLTFQIDGIDLYTTGNMPYSTNWVQKGYTLITGPAQSSFTISIRNNAPGGGGNDWAVDDIKVATCNPVQILNPPNQYIGCDTATNVTFIDTVRTYFPNYKYVRWEKSCDNGANWSALQDDIISFTAKIGNDSVGRSLYNFTPAYADSNCLIRVKAATTSANLSNSNCSVVSSGATRLIISQCTTLKIYFSSISATVNNGYAALKWETDYYIESGYFIIEKSNDGNVFAETGRIKTDALEPGSFYKYSFDDNAVLEEAAYYRIKVSTADGRLYKYSETVFLQNKPGSIKLISYTNPVNGIMEIKLASNKTGMAVIEIINLFGTKLFSQTQYVSKGINKWQMNRFPAAVNGHYYLRIHFNGTVINKPIIKL